MALTVLSWHLGFCIPHQMLDYLVSEQSRVHTLSLIIDGTCTNKENFSGLCKLKKLRSITWKGMSLGVAGDDDGDLVADLGIFQRFFQSNAQHLEYLELELATFFTTDRLPILLRMPKL